MVHDDKGLVGGSLNLWHEFFRTFKFTATAAERRRPELERY